MSDVREAMARAIEAAYANRLRRIVRDGPQGQPPESVDYADAALAAIEASGCVVVPAAQAERMREALEEIAVRLADSQQYQDARDIARAALEPKP